MSNTASPELALHAATKAMRPIECLGQTFPSDEARRAYFTERLRERLRDPVFRGTPGFPRGTDEDILRLSDPPYFTACPNPFLKEFVRIYGREYDATEKYEREPLAIDVSEGKTDALYKAHSYHTKVPHLAIVPSILHYTRPGDLVLDGFAGSGMTGVAAQWCGAAPAEFRQTVEAEWKRASRGRPEWGARRVVLNDLSPAAAFIAANYNLPFDLVAFEAEAKRVLREVNEELGWMYETRHSDGRKGRVEYTVWSEVFSCHECAGEVVFVTEALDKESKHVRDDFPCPSCDARLTKRLLERRYVIEQDHDAGRTVKTPKRIPVLLVYKVGEDTFSKEPDDNDRETLARVTRLGTPAGLPTQELPYMHMTHERARMDSAGVTHVHHFFLPRQRHALAALWRKTSAVPETRLRNQLRFFVEQAVWTTSLLNRYRPTGYSQVNQYLSGVYYVAAQCSEVSPWYVLEGKAKNLLRTFSDQYSRRDFAMITTGDCASIAIPSASIDYVFTDPPFGENIYYADLNYLLESWHRVFTDAGTEAIIDRAKKKGLFEYQDLMRRCFTEYQRVLKPGRWMTVVFSNSSNAVWRAIQEAMGAAGFVVADVRTLDKQQGSYRQVTSSAVKQDLVISAYKPTEALEHTLNVGTASADGAWTFVREHLSKAAAPGLIGDEVQVVAERTAQMLHDRMIAVHVQRGLAVPMDTAEFMTGLAARFAQRDGMYFLPEQAAAYDRARARATGVGQLDLFVNDEATAIAWTRQKLTAKPQGFADLQPQFMKELRNWPKHERALELRDLLRDNFLEYDGDGEVPPQIHEYLSSQYHDLRGLSKADSKLVAKARGRWYVPNHAKQADLDKLRFRALLKEFEEYTQGGTSRLKAFRTEAVRAGFKAAYDRRDWNMIVRVARRLPSQVLQEDEKLLMYYDVAATRIGDE